MISPDFFINSLSQRGIDFFAGVPDSLLKNICAYILQITKTDIIISLQLMRVQL